MKIQDIKILICIYSSTLKKICSIKFFYQKIKKILNQLPKPQTYETRKRANKLQCKQKEGNNKRAEINETENRKTTEENK